jgi:hypothetical protein
MSSREDEPDTPETPDPDIPQDPGIPGFDTTSEGAGPPEQVRKDESAERRERPDEPDLEGHMTAPSGDSETETRER